MIHAAQQLQQWLNIWQLVHMITYNKVLHHRLHTPIVYICVCVHGKDMPLVAIPTRLLLYTHPRSRVDNTVAWCNDPANGEDLVLHLG